MVTVPVHDFAGIQQEMRYRSSKGRERDLDASPGPRFCKLASTAAYGSQYAAE
jgi:hypothetical protein